MWLCAYVHLDMDVESVLHFRGWKLAEKAITMHVHNSLNIAANDFDFHARPSLVTILKH